MHFHNEKFATFTPGTDRKLFEIHYSFKTATHYANKKLSMEYQPAPM